MTELVARGRIVAAEEHRSLKKVYLYRCTAWGIPETEWLFMLGEALPVGLRVELGRAHVGGPLMAYFDGHDHIGVRVAEMTQSLGERSQIVAPFDADAPWPGYHEPDRRVKEWAMEQAEAMGMRLEFVCEQGVWALVADTDRGRVQVPLLPGYTWRDAFESIGMTAYPA